MVHTVLVHTMRNMHSLLNERLCACVSVVLYDLVMIIGMRFGISQILLFVCACGGKFVVAQWVFLCAVDSFQCSHKK